MPEANISSSNPAPASQSIPDEKLEHAGNPTPLPADLVEAVQAAYSRKAEDFRIFDLRGITSLTEFFFITSGTNQRQNQAISDEILRRLKEKRDRMPLGVEGYDKGDWILMDYGDFIVHIFSAQARAYYDLERLWRQAKECDIPADEAPSPAILSSHS
ncbi:MAG: ribosome silencing factor [Bryobacterales bacterium]|nr:ribosome silencing factor [Bryobacterales bacterium]